jgi:hypothetical protein
VQNFWLVCLHFGGYFLTNMIPLLSKYTFEQDNFTRRLDVFLLPPFPKNPILIEPVLRVVLSMADTLTSFTIGPEKKVCVPQSFPKF